VLFSGFRSLLPKSTILQPPWIVPTSGEIFVKHEIIDKKGEREREIHFSSILQERVGHHLFGEKWANKLKNVLVKENLHQRPMNIISANMHSVKNMIFANDALKRPCKTETDYSLYEEISNNKNLQDRILDHALSQGMIYIKDESGCNIDVQIIDKQKRVHMAHMDIHFSNSVNGVAALHTEILKNSELKAFYALYPEKFNNKTNGITFRRWLEFSNQALAAYIKELIGDEYLHDATKLEKLLAFKDDKKVHQQLAKIKFENKLALKAYLKENKGIELDEDSIIDTQIKRFHEYKRQQMNALYVIHKYLEIKAGKLPKRKITVIFGGKAAPAYVIAQDIIHLILCLSELINNDPKVNKYLNVHLVENYNVSVAEKLIPATDISEQISLASKEASGTGNMKFMLNGALTLGTMDGANVEIAELAGAENIYTFGKDSESIIKLYETAGYVSKEYYENDKEIKRAVDFILNPAVVKLGNKTRLERLYNELLNKDWFMTLIDFNAYVDAKEQILADYEDQDSWNEKVVHNIAKAGFFSSDRTIAQYNADIWHCEG